MSVVVVGAVGVVPPAAEVIVVTGPGDEPGAALPPGARVVRQTRSGAGNALACGVAAATGDIIVTLPAAHDPADVPRLVTALRRGADMAEAVPVKRYGDLILLWFMSVLLGCRPAHPGPGYRAFWRDEAARLGLPRVAGTEPAPGDGADGDTLITVRARTAGLTVAEVPVVSPRRGGVPLLTGLGAVISEYRRRRRDGRPVPAPESIVVMTGGPLPDRHPAADHGPRRWPPVNEPAAARLDLPNSSGLGYPDRRQRERRGPDRRTDTGPDRRGSGLQSGDHLNRRRWRDNRGMPDNGRPRTQGRPDLRVINGEGGGSGGSRGHLRPL
ncbi:glycosyltransferase family 2 protein [Actinoplanes utahensis]|uniref:glycosyltransferase family 2 protein n=1 Tax=Actinoplanes utahensis TaxID=1869 RepID=UPI0013767F89|nr:glycosyltransferase [Actinoplanes utahensis]GIF28716.1 hypothetical protein Aut01nite_17020 [Actinoplanes utahensis]